MNDSTTTLDTLKQNVRTFIEEREWQQFQTPKNVSMALSVEVAELMEIFMWETSEASVRTLDQKRDAVEQEVADIASFLLSLCTFYNIDLVKAMARKSQLNALKYPIEKSKGISTRYNDL